MKRRNWKLWAAALALGTTLATASAILADEMPKAGDTITLKFTGQPDRTVTVVKSTKKPNGSIETEVKDAKTGETFTLMDSAPSASTSKATARPAPTVPTVPTIPAAPVAPKAPSAPAIPAASKGPVAPKAPSAPAIPAIPQAYKAAPPPALPTPLPEIPQVSVSPSAPVSRPLKPASPTAQPPIATKPIVRRPAATTSQPPIATKPVVRRPAATTSQPPIATRPTTPIAKPTPPTARSNPTTRPVFPTVRTPRPTYSTGSSGSPGSSASSPRAGVTPMPPTQPESPRERRFFGRLFHRDSEPQSAAGSQKSTVSPVQEERRPFLGRLFGTKKSAPPPAMPAMNLPSPGRFGSRFQPSAEPPQSIPSRRLGAGAVPPPPPGRTNPVFPPRPAVPSVPVPLPTSIPAPLPERPGSGSVSRLPAGKSSLGVAGNGVRPAGFAPAAATPIPADIRPSAIALRSASAPSERILAARSLAEGRHGSSEAVKRLLLRSAKHDPCPAVKVCCIEGLRKLGYYDPSFLRYLGDACTDPADEVRTAAKKALVQMAPN